MIGRCHEVRDVFAGVDARAFPPGLAAAVREWRPDLILRETGEYASVVVAESEGIPVATVSIGLEKTEDFAASVVDGAMEELGSQRGVAGLREAQTFSTVAAGMGAFPELYQAVIDALAGEPVRVLLTVGEPAIPMRSVRCRRTCM